MVASLRQHVLVDPDRLRVQVAEVDATRHTE